MKCLVIGAGNAGRPVARLLNKGAGNAGRPVARLLNNQDYDVVITDPKKLSDFKTDVQSICLILKLMFNLY